MQIIFILFNQAVPEEFGILLDSGFSRVWLLQCRLPAFKTAPTAAGGSFNVVVEGKDSEAGHEVVVQ